MDIYLHLSWEVNIMTADQLIWNIAQLEYSLFVVNSYAAGIQQNDGRYITKYFPMSPFVIEQMLLRQGSMGCYQQGYKTNRIKWICFDFDCKEKEEPNVYALYEQCVVPFIHVLDEVGLHYLTEFSGRRGIHVWIIFNKLLTKELGFQIVCEMEQRCTALNGIRESEIWGLDRFPATDSSRNNIVGKQVKFPLSRHRSGARSYFFTGKFQKKEDTESEHFLQEQLAILEGYEPNDSEEIARRLGVSISRANAANFKYRKYRLVGKVEITIDQVVEILSETAVFNRIFRRMQQGLALPQDWTVLLGTLYLCDSNAQLVKGVFQRFPNYDEHKTCRNIEKLGDRYFPATFSYLYRIYGMTMESNLDGEETSLHYLLRRCGLEQNLLVQFEELNEKKAVSDIRITVNKEKAYLKENDEVPDVSVWNKENIIISTVDDEISDFADDPYLINVAVSRAKKKLMLVVTGNEQSRERNITELIDYIQYNNFEVIESKIYSIFDYLYKQYTEERRVYLQKHKKVSEYDSENLMYSLIEDIISANKYSSLDVVCHFPLNMLIKNPELLNEQECQYAMNPATHLDFLIYNRLVKSLCWRLRLTDMNIIKRIPLRLQEIC